MPGFSLFETLIALVIAATLALSVDLALQKIHHQAGLIHQSNQNIFS